MLIALLYCHVLPSTIHVRTSDELRAALRSVTAGSVIRIAPGEYAPNHTVQGVDRLTIEAADPANPPIFRGGTQAFHFSRCSSLTLRNITVAGQSGNGINIDDGGMLESPATGTTLEGIAVRDIGPVGNHDGIKLSGLDRVVVRGCSVNGWGGEGIDMVGCHDVRITDCTLTGKEGFSASAGIQAKGGSRDILIEKCRFVNAGQRPINAGGSTGAAYFRPPSARYEAAGVTIRNCTIEGSMCAVAFVGVDGALCVDNTVRFPQKWVFRVLQESRGERFLPCRNVVVKGNRILFRRQQVQVEVNIGPGTLPETFRFEGNRWLAEDRPEESRPKLPTAETGGIYGRPLPP